MRILHRRCGERCWGIWLIAHSDSLPGSAAPITCFPTWTWIVAVVSSTEVFAAARNVLLDLHVRPAPLLPLGLPGIPHAMLPP